MVLQPGDIPGTPDRIRRVCLIVERNYLGIFSPLGKRKFKGNALLRG
jgi:hypothetical protein